jgi:RNA polymerase sigma-70 factor (ECF subfamily)
MSAVEGQDAHLGIPPAQADIAVPMSDPVSQLAAVYRDFPGLRALILQRVRDPDLAADILQDATVTTLEKLRTGAIAHPENLGGYLYRVALNHLRNHRRKDRSSVSSADGLEELADDVDDTECDRVGQSQWRVAVRALLDDMTGTRDREILERFYLGDEDKGKICRELGLSQQHFNRVIFRARNRFKEILERRGYGKVDILAVLVAALWALEYFR